MSRATGGIGSPFWLCGGALVADMICLKDEVVDPEARAVEAVSSLDSEEVAARESPPALSGCAVCLVQLATRAFAVHSTQEHVQLAFCTACGLNIAFPVHSVSYLSQHNFLQTCGLHA